MEKLLLKMHKKNVKCALMVFQFGLIPSTKIGKYVEIVGILKRNELGSLLTFHRNSFVYFLRIMVPNETMKKHLK